MAGHMAVSDGNPMLYWPFLHEMQEKSFSSRSGRRSESPSQPLWPVSGWLLWKHCVLLIQGFLDLGHRYLQHVPGDSQVPALTAGPQDSEQMQTKQRPLTRSLTRATLAWTPSCTSHSVRCLYSHPTPVGQRGRSGVPL